MGNISEIEKAERFFKIYETMYNDPVIKVSHLKRKLNLYYNSLINHLNEMYEKKMLIGPYLSVRAHSAHKEYAYFIWSKNPFKMCEHLAKDSRVLYVTRGCGDWNIVVVSIHSLDFSRWEGMYTIVHQGVRYGVYTSKVQNNSQKKSLKEICYTSNISIIPEKNERTHVPKPQWGVKEWTLYHAFRSNMRKKVHPILRKYGISYRVYKKWKETLTNYCTIHLEYYPGGFHTYLPVYWLLETDYEKSIKQLFSLFPTSTNYIEIGDRLLVLVALPNNAFEIVHSFFYKLKTEKIIKNLRSAVFY